MTGKLSSAWRSITGPAPVCRPADHIAARQYYSRLLKAIEHGGWTKGERQYLYVERDKWRKRAGGRDAVFEVAGTKGGRLSMSERAKIELLRATWRENRQVGRKAKGR